MVAAEKVTVETEELTLDQIIWRKFRRPMPGLFEKTMEANQNLSTLLPILPVGTVFTIPATELSTAADLPVIALWE